MVVFPNVNMGRQEGVLWRLCRATARPHRRHYRDGDIVLGAVGSWSHIASFARITFL